jgi:hypothetical protein
LGTTGTLAATFDDLIDCRLQYGVMPHTEDATMRRDTDVLIRKTASLVVVTG